ncbi:MAG: hypothetical protein P0Y53_06495 [Candidatus Pseudobacter hemicellulosilyticus]|uniref:Uncharacterized protein n=1 Tax=Candidatus Pseudobacter hemicellulosilyticus TaxID=3121375 RepID=A0AAJ6BIR5_9BACT|nr:MAG: hypothetical protein P0Y53_06495 [Pseudobacter sp.]
MRIIGIILIVVGILLGYYGFTKLDNSKADVKIGDLEISAKDKPNTTSAWLMIGAGVVGLVAGGAMLAKKE